MTKEKRVEQLRTRVRIAIAGTGLALCMIPLLTTPLEEQSIPYETESETETEIIRWKEVEEVSIQPMEEVNVAEPEEPELVSLGEFKLTAYCSCNECCGEWALDRPLDENGNEIVYGASGAMLEAGRSIAVDPEVIPYGTILIINGHEYVAEDCGSSIKGNHIDIYYSCHQTAKEFGIQYAEVFTYGE